MSVLDDLLKSNDDFALQKTQGYPSDGVQTSGDDTANEEHNIVVDYARKLQQKQPQIADDATETPAYEPGKFLKDYLKANEGFKPLTAEQQAEEKKRQDRNLLLGSIGDALSAFHTAYANARGTKPMVNPGESLTGKMRERYERLNKEREMRDKEYYSGMMRARQMDQQAENADRNWKAQLERYRMQDENAKAKLAEEKAAREAKEKANKQKNDHLTQYEIAKAQGDRQKAAYYKALSEGKTNEQAMAIANATPKTKPTKRGSRSYASSKTVGNTTIYYDANGKEVKRIVKQPGVQTQGSQGTQKRDSNGNIIINY